MELKSANPEIEVSLDADLLQRYSGKFASLIKMKKSNREKRKEEKGSHATWAIL